MSLRPADRRTLFDAGFTDSEIWTLHFAVDQGGNRQPRIDLSSAVWQERIRERRQRVERIKRVYFEAKGYPLSPWKLARAINLLHAQHGQK